MNFHGLDDTSAIVDSISKTTAQLGVIGNWFFVGNILLLVGGSMISYPLHWGEFRARWFFWTTLILALLHVWQPYIGSLFGVWWLWCLAWSRSDFFARKAILIPD